MNLFSFISISGINYVIEAILFYINSIYTSSYNVIGIVNNISLYIISYGITTEINSSRNTFNAPKCIIIRRSPFTTLIFAYSIIFNNIFLGILQINSTTITSVSTRTSPRIWRSRTSFSPTIIINDIFSYRIIH